MAMPDCHGDLWFMNKGLKDILKKYPQKKLVTVSYSIRECSILFSNSLVQTLPVIFGNAGASVLYWSLSSTTTCLVVQDTGS